MAEISEKFGNLPNSNLTTMFSSPSGMERKWSKFPSSIKAKKSMFGTPQAPKKTWSLQSIGPSKAKGLSIRTTSELNIYGSNNANVTDAKQTPRQTVSPAKQKFLQKQSVKLNRKRDQTTVRDSFLGESKKLMDTEKMAPNSSEEDAFSLPEPEILANDYDEEAEFYKNCTEMLDMEFKELKMCMPHVDEDDEGFISDPEPLHSKVPFKIYEDPVFEDSNSAMELDLPEVSDIEEM